MRNIADTGFLVAFLNRKDRFHNWAVGIAREVDAPMLTCEAVLAETVHHVRSTSHVLELIETGLIRIEFQVTSALSRLERLAERYADRQPDLADLCLICLSEDFPTCKVVTVDSDFLIYRRWDREAIPTLRPG